MFFFIVHNTSKQIQVLRRCQYAKLMADLSLELEVVKSCVETSYTLKLNFPEQVEQWR